MALVFVRLWIFRRGQVSVSSEGIWSPTHSPSRQFSQLIDTTLPCVAKASVPHTFFTFQHLNWRATIQGLHQELPHKSHCLSQGQWGLAEGRKQDIASAMPGAVTSKSSSILGSLPCTD